VAQLTKQTFSTIVWIVWGWCPVAEAVPADCSTELARRWQNSGHRTGCVISMPPVLVQDLSLNRTCQQWLWP